MEETPIDMHHHSATRTSRVTGCTWKEHPYGCMIAHTGHKTRVAGSHMEGTQLGSEARGPVGLLGLAVLGGINRRRDPLPLIHWLCQEDLGGVIRVHERLVHVHVAVPRNWRYALVEAGHCLVGAPLYCPNVPA